MTFLSRLSATRLAVLATLLAAVAGTAPAAARAEADPPSVRLIAASDEVTLYKQGRRGPVRLDLGVWVAATGGDFELRVVRPDYDSPVEIKQVDAETGSVLRPLPADVLDGRAGLREFISVAIRNDAGRLVRWRRFSFCPNVFERQRVGDAGPQVPRYPMFCGGWLPFAKGMVWGIDDDWAVNAFGADDFGGGGTPSVRIRPGHYTITVRIARPYYGLFRIRDADAKVVLDATVKRAPRGGQSGLASGDEPAVPARSGSVPTVTDPDPSTVPDLVALPAWNIMVIHRRGRDYLAFAASPWNAGPAPLVVEGFRRPGEDTMDAYQYFHDAAGNPVGRAPAGEMRFDPRRGHEHWHFLQFAAYTLIDASGNEVVRSKKQAYCLFPTDAVDLTIPGANWQPWSLGLHTACGFSRSTLWVREDLDVGWADTYFQSVPGQSFDVTKLPRGWYTVRVQLNPLGALHEATTANNVEDRLVYLRGRPGHKRVIVSPWHDIAE